VELFERNRADTRAGGVVEDPDLIYPGDVLRVR